MEIELTKKEVSDLLLALQSHIVKLSKSTHSAAPNQLVRMESLEDKLECALSKTIVDEVFSADINGVSVNPAR